MQKIRIVKAIEATDKYGAPGYRVWFEALESNKRFSQFLHKPDTMMKEEHFNHAKHNLHKFMQLFELTPSTPTYEWLNHEAWMEGDIS